MSLLRRARPRYATLFALALFMLPVMLAGCNFKSAGFVISKPAHVRFFNALVDGGAINVTIGDQSPVTGLPFEGLTTYQDITSGNQRVTITVGGGASTIVDTTTLFTDDAFSTYLIFGTSAGPSPVLISDVVPNTPGSGLFVLRAINAAFSSAGLDVYVTSPGAPLANMSPNVSNLAYGSQSAFLLFNAGSYQVRMTLPNSKQVIYDAGTQTFAERTAYQIVGYTKGSGTLVNGAFLALDATGTGNVVNNAIAQFKLIHAAPGTAAINAFVDGIAQFISVPYAAASSYETVPAGAHVLTVDTVTSPGAPIATAQPTFGAATNTSVIVTGLPGAQTALVLADDNLPGTAGNARVRFVNVAPDVAAVDVLVNFAKQVVGLPVNTASSYRELAENTYAISFQLTGTQTALVNLPAVALTAGRTYSLYLIGTSGQYSGTLTADR
jgi:hypothetical protein